MRKSKRKRSFRASKTGMGLMVGMKNKGRLASFCNPSGGEKFKWLKWPQTHHAHGLAGQFTVFRAAHEKRQMHIKSIEYSSPKHNQSVGQWMIMEQKCGFTGTDHLKVFLGHITDLGAIRQSAYVCFQHHRGLLGLL